MEPGDTVILHQPFVRGHVFIYVCPLSAMRVGLIPKLDPPLYYRIFCAFWEKGPFRREKRKREKEGANKERTTRTVDVRGAAKTANNGRGQ